MERKIITLKFHYGGSFKKQFGRKISYCGEKEEWSFLEADKLDVFSIVNSYRKRSYFGNIENLYLLVPGKPMENGLMRLDNENDSHLLELVTDATKNNGVIDVYCEHPVVGDPEIMVESAPHREASEGEEGRGGWWSDYSYNSEELRTPISSEDEGDSPAEIIYPEFNEAATFGHVSLELGMKFTTLDAFKKGVKDYTIQLGREIKWVKNDKARARAKCKNQNCRWEIFCSWSNVYGCYQIKTFISEHSCNRGFKNSQANRKWVVDKLARKLIKQPNLTHGEAYDYMKSKCELHLSDSQIYRSLKEAREIMDGDESDRRGRRHQGVSKLKRQKKKRAVTSESCSVAVPEEIQLSQPQYSQDGINQEGSSTVNAPIVPISQPTSTEFAAPTSRTAIALGTATAASTSSIPAQTFDGSSHAHTSESGPIAPSTSVPISSAGLSEE